MRKVFIFLFLVGYLPLMSQSSNIAQYLDDGGRTSARNIIKTDFSQMLRANIPIIFEHLFDYNFSLQGGVGILTHNVYRPLFKPILRTKDMYSELKGGFSLYFKPSFYFSGFESIHFGIPFHYRRHGNQAESYEFGLSIGKQWFYGRHLCFDIEVGVGFNLEYSLDGVSYIYFPGDVDSNYDVSFRERAVTPLSFKIGYVL